METAIDQWFSTVVPVLLTATVLSVAVVVALKVVQTSLRRLELSPADFPFARKLAPAAVLTCVFVVVRSFDGTLEDAGITRWPISIGIIWSVAYLLGRGIWVASQLLYARFDMSSDDNLRSRRVQTQMQYVEKTSYAAIVFLALCATLLLFPGARSFGQSLLTSAGVAGIILGLAAQKSLSNLIAGFQIAFTQPMRIEDAVVVEGEWGWIEEINLTYVVVRVWDLRRLVLPITYFVEKPFQNWTRTRAQILGAVTLEVSHEVPFAEVEAELNRLLDESPMWDRDKRVLQMIEVQERSVTLRALMTAKDSPTCWDLRCHVRRGLVEFLRENHPESWPKVRLSPSPFDDAQQRVRERRSA